MSTEDRLRQELHRASATLPSVGVDFEATLTRGRSARRRSRHATLAAAAVALIAGASAATVLAGSVPGAELPPVADAPTSSPTPTSGPTPTEQEPTPSTSASAVQGTSVEPALRTWLEAIQEGDEEQAWGLMTPEAQTAVGRDRFDQLMASALPEGLGAFAHAPDFHDVVVSDDAVESMVAVVSGEVTREGITEFAAAAIPLRVSDDETLVDHAFISPYYDRVAAFASVSAGPLSFRAGDELAVTFATPEGAAQVLIAVDDDREPLPTEFDPAAGRATATLDRDLEAGRHIATVIVVHESGLLHPEAIVFEAAAP